MLKWFLGLLLALIPAAANAETVVVTADRMIDVLSGRVVEEPVVVITDGRIVSVVGRGGARPLIPTGARRIDLPGMTILPGLIDMHVHLDSSPYYGPYESLQFTDLFHAVMGPGHARDMLDAGFTTVRNVGSGHYADVAYMQAIDAGRMAGPRIVPATHALSATGGHCDETFLPPQYHRPAEGVADGPQLLRQRVRELRRNGAQVIKVCATGGVFSRNTEPGQQQLSEEELRAIADEAHMWGMKVAAHAHGAAGIRAAIRAGIDTIEHASLIDAEGIKLARQRGAYLAMDMITRFVIVPLSLAPLFLTGPILSLGTPWGLFKHYWIIVKLVINVLSTIILLIHLQPIGYLARSAVNGTLSSADHELQTQMVFAAGAGLAALLAATTLAVYKPRGMTKYGWRKQYNESNEQIKKT